MDLRIRWSTGLCNKDNQLCNTLWITFSSHFRNTFLLIANPLSGTPDRVNRMLFGGRRKDSLLLVLAAVLLQPLVDEGRVLEQES